MTRQTKNKHFTEPLYYTHVQQDNQVLIISADAVLTQTQTTMPPPAFPEEFRDILIYTFLILALKQGSHI